MACLGNALALNLSLSYASLSKGLIARGISRAFSYSSIGVLVE
jgi:hypothetical protein